MPHWHCHASNQQQTTNNEFLCRLQGTPLVPFTAHALNRRIPIVTKSNQYAGAPFLPSVHIPIHRCTVPSICPRTNTQVYRSFHLPTYHSSKRVVSMLLLKTKFRDERLEYILGHMFREKVCSISRTRNLL